LPHLQLQADIFLPLQLALQQLVLELQPLVNFFKPMGLVQQSLPPSQLGQRSVSLSLPQLEPGQSLLGQVRSTSGSLALVEVDKVETEKLLLTLPHRVQRELAVVRTLESLMPQSFPLPSL